VGSVPQVGVLPGVVVAVSIPAHASPAPVSLERAMLRRQGIVIRRRTARGNVRRPKTASGGSQKHLCQEGNVPNLRSAFTNLKAPMPLGRKIQRLIANNWTKVRTRSSCCGHRGEPGC